MSEQSGSRSPADNRPPRRTRADRPPAEPAPNASVPNTGAADASAPNAGEEEFLVPLGSPSGGRAGAAAEPLRLADPPSPPDPPGPPDPAAVTETLLNSLIEECRYLLHEVAFHSACLASDPGDRIRFLAAAQELAVAGATVGKVVARLRSSKGSPQPEQVHRLVYEHVQTPPPSWGDDS